MPLLSFHVRFVAIHCYLWTVAPAEPAGWLRPATGMHRLNVFKCDITTWHADVIRYIPDIYPIYFQHLSASVRPKRPASRSNNLKNVHASQTSSPSVSKYSRTSEESNFSSNIAKVITPVSCSSNLLKSLRIFWMCISLLARMDCTTVAWSFWALSMALWQKTPVTWNLVMMMM